MRVFVTGSTGFIGSAIVRELLGAGHSVLGLARTDRAVATLHALGAEAHPGDITDPASLAAGATGCDGVIHAAFIHDFTAYAAAAKADRQAVAAMTDALAGTNKPVIATSVAVLLQAGRTGRETDAPFPESPLGARGASERAVLQAAGTGLRTAAIRLPASVHGAGDHGFVPALIAIAREKGFAACIGDGTNRWPAVHRTDAARLYRLAVESAPPGAVLHAVAEEGITLRDIATTIATALNLPVRHLDPADATAYFGWLTPFVSLDNPVSSAITQQTLGWQPTGAGLLDDMTGSGYFA